MKRFGSIIWKGLLPYPAISILTFLSPVLYADDAGQWRNGPQVYIKICHYCHDTGIAPAIKERGLAPHYISSIVRNGLRAMPAFRATEIDDEALKQLSNYINATIAEDK